MTERLVEYEHDGVVLEGLLAVDEDATGARPGVAIAHAWGGRGKVEESTARQLAALGYAAFAIDMFGKDVRGTSKEENAGLIAPFLADRNLLQERIKRSVSVLREQPEVDSAKVAAIGYCFGGLCVLDLARSGADVQGVVSIHGLFNPPDPAPDAKISARVLALHGHEDPMVPVVAVNALEEELTRAGADWQVHVYGGTKHAFTNPEANDPEFGTVYNETAAQRSWTTLCAFLEEVLK